MPARAVHAPVADARSFAWAGLHGRCHGHGWDSPVPPTGGDSGRLVELVDVRSRPAAPARSAVGSTHGRSTASCSITRLSGVCRNRSERMPRILRARGRRYCAGTRAADPWTACRRCSTVTPLSYVCYGCGCRRLRVEGSFGTRSRRSPSLAGLPGYVGRSLIDRHTAIVPRIALGEVSEGSGCGSKVGPVVVGHVFLHKHLGGQAPGRKIQCLTSH
jgi:hypothetical protein